MGKQFLNADANRNASWREEERSGTERARTDRPQNLWIADDEGLILLVPNGNYPHFSERLDAPSRVSSVVWMGCNSRAGGVVVEVGRVRMRRNGFLGFFRSSSSRISTFFPQLGIVPLDRAPLLRPLDRVRRPRQVGHPGFPVPYRYSYRLVLGSARTN